MAKQKLNKKKLIQERIEFRRSKISTINKRNFIDEKKDKKINDNNIVANNRNSLRFGSVNNNTDDSDQLSLLSLEKEPISIFITAYKSQDFIEECLDSIENQTYFIDNDNYEILIGIDGCFDTLFKLKEIRYKYRNLRIFFMFPNKGTYVTSNTLLDLVKYENIIRFDSDDIMIPEMVNKIMLNCKNNDFIRFKFFNYSEDKILKSQRRVNMYANGIVFYKKRIFEILGGYEPWICSADTDLIERANNIFNIYYINDYLFYRRNHDNSLTRNKRTDFKSEIRKDSFKKIAENKENNITFVEKKINTFVEI